jgi:hypothetical protein
MSKKYSSESGIAALAIILFFVFLILLITGIDLGFIEYQKLCHGESIGKCWNERNYPTPTPAPNRTVVSAKGSIGADKYNVQVTLNVPLEGGAIEGTFSGTCNGTITGDFTGGENGTLTGKAFGSCSPVLVPLPASAEFTGKVDQRSKNVPISGNGNVAGVSKEGSITLTY